MTVFSNADDTETNCTINTSLNSFDSGYNNLTGYGISNPNYNVSTGYNTTTGNGYNINNFYKGGNVGYPMQYGQRQYEGNHPAQYQGTDVVIINTRPPIFSKEILPF